MKAGTQGCTSLYNVCRGKWQPHQQFSLTRLLPPVGGRMADKFEITTMCRFISGEGGYGVSLLPQFGDPCTNQRRNYRAGCISTRLHGSLWASCIFDFTAVPFSTACSRQNIAWAPARVLLQNERQKGDMLGAFCRQTKKPAATGEHICTN